MQRLLARAIGVVMGPAKFVKTGARVGIAVVLIAAAAGAGSSLNAQSFAVLPVSASVMAVRNTDSLASQAANDITNNITNSYDGQPTWREQLGGLAIVRANQPSSPLEPIKVTLAYAAN